MKFKRVEKTYLRIRDTLQFRVPFLYKSLRYVKRRMLLVGTTFRPYIWRVLGLQRGVLVYVGLNRGDSFSSLFYKYKRAIGIEANPELMPELHQRFGKYKSVELYNVAASSVDGQAQLTLPDNGNHAASATLDSFGNSRSINGVRKIHVDAVHLGNFLQRIRVVRVDSYISDCEGYDYIALKSCQDFLDQGNFLEIQCEVQRNHTPEVYISVSNKEHMFDTLLSGNYEKIASGWTFLRNGIFDEVPSDWVFHDVKWKLTKLGK